MSQRQVALFCEYDTGKMLGKQQQDLLQAIDNYPVADLLRANPAELVAEWREKFRVDVPTFLEAEITQDTREIQIDQSGNGSVYIRDRSRPFYVKGTSVTFHVPYSGDGQFFRCQPSSYSINSPEIAELQDAAIVLEFTGTDLVAQTVKAELEGQLSTIKSHLDRLRSDVGDFNERLSAIIDRRIEERRSKVLKDQSLATDLGFPLRRRTDAPSTYVAPTVRRKPPVQPRNAGAALPAKSEPVMDFAEYEHILSVIQQMVTVIERSPSAFAGMKEEHLRQHFLVQLNGQYEGQATGETFNYEGKTDILVRVEGRNIFIAECKFWDGPKTLTDAMDQLLGYASWRDTKLALLVFVRSNDFTAVVKRIGETASGHGAVIRKVEFPSESGYRFVVRHRDDADRELTLTILAFHVPS